METSGLEEGHKKGREMKERNESQTECYVTEHNVSIFLPALKKRLNRDPSWPTGANPRLNFNLGFFFFSSKGFSEIIFSILFRAPIIKLQPFLKLSYLKSNFTLTLSYLNPALNNPGQYNTTGWYPTVRP